MRPNTPDSLALVGFIAVGVLYGGGKPNAPSPPNLVNPVNPVQNNISARAGLSQRTTDGQDKHGGTCLPCSSCRPASCRAA